MTSESSTGAVRRDISTVKTIGALNIIFSVLLMVIIPCAGMYFGFLASLPRLLKFQNARVNEAVKNSQKRRLEDLAEREKKAQAPEEKAELRAERARVLGSAELVPTMPDLESFTGSFRQPIVVAFVATELTTGFLVNLAMLVAGIGLVTLREWGRKLAIGVAVLKVLRLVLLYGAYIVIVEPASFGTMEKNYLETVETDPALPAAASKAARDKEKTELERTMRTVSIAQGLGMMAVGSIYPVVVVLGLRRASARAACQRPAGAGGSAPAA